MRPASSRKSFTARCFEGTVSSRRSAKPAPRRMNEAGSVNTWAAYQCYGDPDWVFRRSGADANRFTGPLVEDFSGVASATVVEARAGADHRPDEVSGRRCGRAARQSHRAREAVWREVGQQRVTWPSSSARRSSRRATSRPACSGTSARWRRRTARRRSGPPNSSPTSAAVSRGRSWTRR